MNADQLRGLLEELNKDRLAILAARDAISRRMVEVEDSPHREWFTDSPGIQALWNVLAMDTARWEGLLEDFSRVLRDRKEPSLRLVEVPNEPE